MLKSLIVSMAMAFAAATPAFASLEWQWQFDTAANPATPQIGSLGSTATITVGDFGAGWHNDWGLGSATGYWDMGINGSVALHIPNLASPSGPYSATLSIVQWVDDLFTGNLTYSVPGTQVGGTTIQVIEDTGFGSWVEYDTVWSLLASSNPVDITITGPEGGAIFNQISVVPVVPEPTTIIAGALLLLPFGASTLRVLRRSRVC